MTYFTLLVMVKFNVKARKISRHLLEQFLKEEENENIVYSL